MTRSFFSLSCLFLVGLFVNGSMAASYNANHNKLLQLQISNLGPTRISMDHQKIMDAFYYPQEAIKLILHQSGSVFVVPNEEHKHVYVTLVGEDGSTQDLRLKFVFKQPEPIMISFKNDLTTTQKFNGEKKDGNNTSKSQ